MSRRVSLLLIALFVLVAACAQARPARTPLPTLPDDIEFLAITTTTADPIPNDGSCYLVQAVGATVTSTLEGYDAAAVLHAGDVITSFDGIPVTGPAALILAVSAHSPGDTVRLEYTRDGSARSTDIVLGAASDDAAAAHIGVGIDTAISGAALDELDEAPVPIGAHYAIVGTSLLRVLLGDGIWFPTGIAAPSSSIVDVAGGLFVADPAGLPILASIDAGTSIPIPIEGHALSRALTSMQDRVLISVHDGPAYRILAIDQGASSPAWTWRVADGLGATAEPLLGYESPLGDLAILTLEQAGSRYSLLDSAGEVVAGFGSAQELIPVGGAFAGWFDATHIAYVTSAASGISLSTIDVALFTSTVVANIDSDEELRQAWSAADGRHVATVGETDTTLYDLTSNTRHLLARNCEIGFIGGSSL
jgi:PDZ domain